MTDPAPTSPATPHGGDRVAAVLQTHGVRFVFTLCGGHISPILVGCKRRDIRVVDVRHEATAVFAADAVSRLTGTPGVAVVTAGPGVTNTVTAIKNARLAQSALVLLGGATATALKGRGALQDIDQLALVAPHVKWSASARRVRDLAPLVERAFRVARQGVPGPVFVECPVDLLYPESIVRDWYGANRAGGGSIGSRLLDLYLRRHVDRLFAGAGPIRADRGSETPVPQPSTAGVDRAARALAAARRPVLLVGSQALLDAGGAQSLAEAITRLGVPTFLSGMARGLLGQDHPLQVRHKRKQALKEADMAILAGVPCDFRLNYGRHLGRKTRVVAANRSSRDLRLNRRPDLGLRCDAGSFLRRLAGVPGAKPSRWDDWRRGLAARDEERNDEIAGQSEQNTDGVNPMWLCRAIDETIADDSVLIADGGDFVATASYIVRPRRPLSWLDPGVFGTLGVGAGFALGAKLCRPDSEVWLLYGDGSAGYSLSELDTFVRHGLPVVAVVGNDACWMQIARDQQDLLGDGVGCALLPTDYHRVAEGFGAAGVLLEDRDATVAALRRAKAFAAEGRAVLVNARIGRTDFRKGSISI